jgi:hypothetical protein
VAAAPEEPSNDVPEDFAGSITAAFFPICVVNFRQAMDGTILLQAAFASHRTDAKKEFET